MDDELMSFSEALEACRNGAKIARAGWNGAKLGKVAFIVYQKAYPNGIEINANSAEALGLPEKTVCAFEPYLMLAVKCDDEHPTAKFKCRPWTPDQRDQLAEDWKIVE